MKFEREELPFVEPFAVCGILLGLTVIGLRILFAVFVVPKATQLGLTKGSVIVSAAVGMVYGAFSLRERLKGSLADRVLYVVVIAIFASIILGALFLM